LDCPGCRVLTSLNLSTSPAIASIVSSGGDRSLDVES
jgi:hypothetical protein